MKYLAEAIAETVAQVGVNGFRGVFKGICLPIRERYVTFLTPRAPALTPRNSLLSAEALRTLWDETR